MLDCLTAGALICSHPHLGRCLSQQHGAMWKAPKKGAAGRWCRAHNSGWGFRTAWLSALGQTRWMLFAALVGTGMLHKQGLLDVLHWTLTHPPFSLGHSLFIELVTRVALMEITCFLKAEAFLEFCCVLVTTDHSQESETLSTLRKQWASFSCLQSHTSGEQGKTLSGEHSLLLVYVSFFPGSKSGFRCIALR